MTRRLHFLFLALALLAALPAAARAGDDITLDKVIVSARGGDSIQSETPGGTGVVEAEDIELSAKASVADTLDRISGVSQAGDSPWGQDVSIRGLTGSSVVVLIDGMRLNTATEMNARLGFINSLDIERIEVLKGPVSSLYGSGSTGGVINIITKKGDFTPEQEIHGEAFAGWTSNPDGGDGYGRLNYSSESLWLQLSGGLRDHDAFEGGDGTEMVNSQYQDDSFRLAGGLRWSEMLRTDFQIMNIEANDVGIPGGSGTMPQSAPITYPRSKNTLISMNTILTPPSDVVEEVLLNAYFMKNDRRVRIDNPTAAVKKITPYADHETWGGKLQGKFNLGAHALTAGADAWNWHMTSVRYRHLVNGNVLTDHPTPNTTQLSMGVFAEDDWGLTDDLTLNLGARLDHIKIDNKANTNFEEGDSEDDGWNVHAGLTWTPAEHWSHTFLAASSYRAADIVERFKYINLSATTISKGNPDLDPEKSYYFEYGLHYNTGTLSASASAYANYVTDYIEEQLESPGVYVMQNVGEARIYGLELDADWRFHPGWSLYGNVALCDGEDEETDQPLRSVAPVNGRAGVRYDHGNGWWARVEMPWALRQDDVPDGSEETPGWTSVNIATGYGFDLGVTRHELAFGVDNLLDRKYENYLSNSRAMTLLEPGMNVFLNYKVNF